MRKERGAGNDEDMEYLAVVAEREAGLVSINLLCSLALSPH